MKRIFAAIVFLAIFTTASAANEAAHRDLWCSRHGGNIEVNVPDVEGGGHTRADCVTDTHAIEFDWAHKWAEAIGQSMYYATRLGKRPGIVLIVAPGEERYLQRLRAVAVPQFVDVWVMEPIR